MSNNRRHRRDRLSLLPAPPPIVLAPEVSSPLSVPLDEAPEMITLTALYDAARVAHSRGFNRGLSIGFAIGSVITFAVAAVMVWL